MHRPCARNTHFLLLAILAVWVAGQVSACTPPERPFLPQNREDMQVYADLIRADFEVYIADVQAYFRCLDAERARAFVEAGEVSEDYRRFVGAVE